MELHRKLSLFIIRTYLLSRVDYNSDESFIFVYESKYAMHPTVVATVTYIKTEDNKLYAMFKAKTDSPTTSLDVKAHSAMELEAINTAETIRKCLSVKNVTTKI